MITTRSLLAGALVALLATAPAASATSAGPRVARGYDLFRTPDGSSLGVVVAGTLMTFEGVPYGSFDFGSRGVHETGTADTVVRRLDVATPAHPSVRIELVGLQMVSTNVPGYYVTLQSARPLGLPSIGTLDFEFDTEGIGGLLSSELLVNYDVRYGALDGPIVATGSTGMGFVAEDVLWLGTVGDETAPSPCVMVQSMTVCVDEELICHDAGGLIKHQHCNKTDGVPLIAGVNHLLNGTDTAADFHPVGTASQA